MGKEQRGQEGGSQNPEREESCEESQKESLDRETSDLKEKRGHANPGPFFFQTDRVPAITFVPQTGGSVLFFLCYDVAIAMDASGSRSKLPLWFKC